MVHRDVISVTSRAQKVKVEPGAGTLLWILQRLSSYGLLLFLPIHLYFTYFTKLDTPALTYNGMRETFRAFPLWYVLNEGLLLICALFHGLNGFRNVIYDWTTNSAVRHTVNFLLIVLGIAGAILGFWTLWALA